MKKIILLFFFAGLMSHSYCQNNKLGFKLKCFSAKDLNFIFMIDNISNDTIKIPSEYLAVPIGNPEGSLEFEIYYCANNDTINVLNTIKTHIGGEFLHENDFLLGPHKSFLFEIKLRSVYFRKDGIYKIRFKLRESFFPNILYSDQSSDWIFINIKK